MMTTLAHIARATLVTANAERVWDALTATKTSLGCFHGMTVTSDWQPGSTITVRQEDELGQGDTRKLWAVAVPVEKCWPPTHPIDSPTPSENANRNPPPM